MILSNKQHWRFRGRDLTAARFQGRDVWPKSSAIHFPPIITDYRWGNASYGEPVVYSGITPAGSRYIIGSWGRAVPMVVRIARNGYDFDMTFAGAASDGFIFCYTLGNVGYFQNYSTSSRMLGAVTIQASQFFSINLDTGEFDLSNWTLPLTGSGITPAPALVSNYNVFRFANGNWLYRTAGTNAFSIWNPVTNAVIGSLSGDFRNNANGCITAVVTKAGGFITQDGKRGSGLIAGSVINMCETDDFYCVKGESNQNYNLFSKADIATMAGGGESWAGIRTTLTISGGGQYPVAYGKNFYTGGSTAYKIIPNAATPSASYFEAVPNFSGGNALPCPVAGGIVYTNGAALVL